MSQAPVAITARPQFHDRDLQSALEKAGPQIESFTSRLDALSSDIKALESYLDRSAVRIETRVKIDAYRGSSGEYIAWELGDPDRFRVVYYRFDNDDGMSDRNVLIEAPIAIRVKARPFLGDLLRAVGEAATLGGSDGEAPPVPSDDDMPF